MRTTVVAITLRIRAQAVVLVPLILVPEILMISIGLIVAGMRTILVVLTLHHLTRYVNQKRTPVVLYQLVIVDGRIQPWCHTHQQCLRILAQCHKVLVGGSMVGLKRKCRNILECLVCSLAWCNQQDQWHMLNLCPS